MLLPFMSNKEDKFGEQSDSIWSDVTAWLNESGLMSRQVNEDDAYTDITKKRWLDKLK